MKMKCGGRFMLFSMLSMATNSLDGAQLKVLQHLYDAIERDFQIKMLVMSGISVIYMYHRY